MPTDTLREFTGQRKEAGIGLYDYGARFYDPLIGRFVSADTIVPGAGNPQSLNRYAYTFNNPLKFTDPTGHCAFGQDENGNEIITKDDCSVDDFQKLDWKQREKWLLLFIGKHNLGKWINDIYGAVAFQANDPTLGNLGGWSAYMDAGILQALNDGMRINQGKAAIGDNSTHGGAGWSKFFASLQQFRDNDISLNTLIGIRLNTEQQGVDYAKSRPESQRRHASASVEDQMYYDVFLWGADTYRSVAPQARGWIGPLSYVNSPLAVSLTQSTDPRTSWDMLAVLGALGKPVSSYFYTMANNPWALSN